MTAFPTITADTPVNDAEILDAIVTDLDERWRAVGAPDYQYPGTWMSVSPRYAWFKWPLDPADTVSGTYDEETDSTRLDITAPVFAGFGAGFYLWSSPSPGWVGAWVTGRHLKVTGVGTFTVLASGWLDYPEYTRPYVTVQGDATCDGATYEIAPAGNVLNTSFWLILQGIAAAIIPRYLNSYAYPEGFAGEAALSFFALSSEDWLAATGLSHSSPRRIRARGPCSLTYDEEADTTTIVDSGAAPDFVAGHVGHRVDVFGVGQFVVATVEDGATITVEGNAAQGHPDTVVSVLPDDPMDQDDAAFEHGPCDVGDVLGPWLLYDLIAMLKAMKLTATESVFFTNGESQYGAGGAVGYPPDTPGACLARAIADAEAAFAACTPVAGGLGAASGIVWAAFWYPYEFGYGAALERGDGYGVWSVPGDSPLGYDIDLYAIATVPTGPWVTTVPGGNQGYHDRTFDGNGDFDEADVLTLLDSVLGCTALWGQSETLIGDHSAAPAWPPTSESGHTAGYSVSACYGVVKWHFTHVG
jgi:hypothetical protein